MSDTVMLVLLILFMALLALLLAGAIASLAYVLARAPFWPSFRSALKSSALLCAGFFVLILVLRAVVPQKAALPAGGDAPQSRPSPAPQKQSGPENSR